MPAWGLPAGPLGVGDVPSATGAGQVAAEHRDEGLRHDSGKLASELSTPSGQRLCVSALRTGPEVDGVHRALLVGLPHADAYPDLAEALVEDVLPMDWAPHPLAEVFVRQALVSRPPADVLPTRPVRVVLGGVTEALQPGLGGLTVEGLVPEVALVEHLLGVGTGPLREGRMPAQRLEPIFGTRLVVKVQRPLLVAIQLDDLAGAALYGDKAAIGFLARGRVSHDENDHQHHRQR